MFERPRKGVERNALPVPESGLPPDRETLMVVVDGFVDPPEIVVGRGQTDQHARLRLPVALLPCRSKADLMDSQPVRPVLAEVEEVVQGVGKLPGRRVKAAVGSVADGRHQTGAFGLEPSQRFRSSANPSCRLIVSLLME